MTSKKSHNETWLKKQILGWLKEQPKALGVPVPASPFGVSGRSDIFVCWGGRFIAIECKNPDGSGKLTPAQDSFLRRVVKAGGIALVAEDLAYVKHVLENL